MLLTGIKVAYKVQIWKKTFCQNSGKSGYNFIKTTLYLFIYFVFTRNLLFQAYLKLIH